MAAGKGRGEDGMRWPTALRIGEEEKEATGEGDKEERERGKKNKRNGKKENRK